MESSSPCMKDGSFREIPTTTLCREVNVAVAIVAHDALYPCLRYIHNRSDGRAV